MPLLWFILITVKKKCLAMFNNIFMIVSMFFSLSHCTPLICTLQTFATRKRVNHEGEYGLETPNNSNFYGRKKGH